jgi:hypothetical protein
VVFSDWLAWFFVNLIAADVKNAIDQYGWQCG